MYIIVTYNKAIAQMTFTIVNISSYISRRHEGKSCAPLYRVKVMVCNATLKNIAIIS